MEEITAVIQNLIYRNEENGFSVLELKDISTGGLFAAVGNVMYVNVGETVALTGSWVFHKQYGKQLKIASCEVIEPSGAVAMEKYLASGLVRGVGEKIAHLIVERFGEETFDIIEKKPQRLMEIPGIGKVKSAYISMSFIQQRDTRDIMMTLSSFDMSLNQATKIYKLYGNDCVEIIKKNPYRLIDDVENIGFKTADKIAQSAGIAFDSEFRIRAGVKYILEWARAEGHTYLPKESLLNAVETTLGIQAEDAEKALSALIIETRLIAVQIDDTEAIFLPQMRFCESDCAKRLLKICRTEVIKKLSSAETEIKELEKACNINLAKLQKKAIESIVNSGAAVITGGPGTGKTTILKLAIEIFKKYGVTFELCAPTGRAAKRMSGATGEQARTIHRLLEYSQTENAFLRDEDCPLEADVIIVDEMSMVDVMLFHALLKAIGKGTRLIMVGDADQLPSVGAGNVLHDIIKSDTINVIRLKDIYRQSGRSMIITNAHRINAGDMPVYDDTDLEFCLEKKESAEEILDRIIELSLGGDNLPLLTDKPMTDMQVLAPMKKGVLGVKNLNIIMQQALNPPDDKKPEISFGDTIFRLGDKVMQIKNDYSMEWFKKGKEGLDRGTGVFNGDIGSVSDVCVKTDTLTVAFDDGAIATYDRTQMEELELAYCISIHKSQGSEFPVIMLPLLGGVSMFMTRNLLYTAVTRAKNQVYIIGKNTCVNGMVQNNHTKNRYSSLCYMLLKYDKLI